MVTVSESILSDVDVDQIFGSGKGRPSPGDYHMLCIDVTEPDGCNYTDFRFEVVSPGEEVGKQMPLRLFHSAKQGTKSPEEFAKADASVKRRLVGFALRLRVITQQEYEQAKAEHRGLPLDFVGKASGAQAIITVAKQKEPYTDNATGEQRFGVEIPWGGIHDLNDPNYSHVPIDPEIAAMWGVVREPDHDPFKNPKAPQQQQTSKPATQAAKPQTQQPVAAAATAGSKWEDI